MPSEEVNTVRLRKNPNKKTFTLNVNRKIVKKLNEHGVHIPSFIEFELRDLKKKLESGFELSDKYFKSNKEEEGERAPTSFSVDKEMLDWSKEIKKAVDRKTCRLNRSSYLGERLEELYYTLYYDGEAGKTIVKIGNTLKRLESEIRSYRSRGFWENYPGLEQKINVLRGSLEGLKSKTEEVKWYIPTEKDLEELFGEKIDHVSTLDEEAADILRENKRQYFNALRNFFPFAEPDKIMGAYKNILTEIRYGLGKNKELGRELAHKFPSTISYSWPEAIEKYQKFVDNAEKELQ